MKCLPNISGSTITQSGLRQTSLRNQQVKSSTTKKCISSIYQITLLKTLEICLWLYQFMVNYHKMKSRDLSKNMEFHMIRTQLWGNDLNLKMTRNLTQELTSENLLRIRIIFKSLMKATKMRRFHKMRTIPRILSLSLGGDLKS